MTPHEIRLKCCNMRGVLEYILLADAIGAAAKVRPVVITPPTYDCTVPHPSLQYTVQQYCTSILSETPIIKIKHIYIHEQND